MAKDVQKYLCDLETKYTEVILISPVILHSTGRYKKKEHFWNFQRTERNPK